MKPKPKIAVAALAAMFAVFAMIPPATAGPCGARNDIARHLAEKYLEKRRSIALMNTGGILEVYVSAQGSWSIVTSSPSGWSCIVAAGDAWQDDATDLGPEA